MRNEFFEKLIELRKTGEPFVVATVVKVSGSTYRRPGARVLITKDGTVTGLISGGCFESALMERAKRVMESGQTMTVTFDTTASDDLIFGLGLGCTGVAQILLEPFQGSSGQQHLDFIRECISGEQPGVLATVFRVEGQLGVLIGASLMIGTDSHKDHKISNTQLKHAILEQGRSVLEEGRSQIQSFQFEEGTLEVLLEMIPLPVPLVIFGAGPDAVPLVNFAHQLGWRVTIVDRRPAFARADRFPRADAVILCEPDDLAANLSITSLTAAVIMTHHFETDVNFLKQVLPSAAGYIGLLGPQAKADMLLQKVRDEGIIPTNEQLSRIYAPVGLDLGAETPEEIALAIVAEIQSVLQGYPAGFLRDRSGPIHQRVPSAQKQT